MKQTIKQLMKQDKKALILSIIVFATLIIVVMGATYAYFKAETGEAGNTLINAQTASVDILNFKTGKEINLNVSQNEFGKDAGDKSDSTTAIATFIAQNSKNIESSSNKYNVYIVIEDNDFVYTTESANPELVLKVTDPNGNEVKNITGLVHYEKGFDITTKTGGFLVTADYDISALRGETTTQEWKVDVTFLNLDANQNKNMGKTMTAKFYITKEKIATYTLPEINSINPDTTYKSITATLDLKEGTAKIDKYYFGIEEETTDTTGYLDKSINRIIPLAATDVTFVETDEPEYTFNNLKENTTYKIYSYAIDENKFKTNLYETEATTNEYINAQINGSSVEVTLNSIIITVDTTKGDSEIVKYFYSKDDGETYEESTSNTHIFTDLNDTTEYKIKVKLLDSKGRYSTEYFDAVATETYILPTITTVSATTKWNEITLATTGEKGTNNVSKYYYSINGGEYLEGSSTYTFTNLTDNTKYSIKVKVEDTNGRVSNEYTLQATTDEYILPTVTNVETSTTKSEITISVEAEDGTGQVNKYYYSKDDGSNYVESDSSSYTFSDLTSEATFYLKVYVKDNNEKTSTEYSLTAKTEKSIFITTNNLPTTYGKLGVVSCTAGTATYNQRYNRIEIPQVGDKYTLCSLDYTDSISKTNLATYVKGLAGKTQGTGQVVNENGYRYEGTNPNNYVWFNNEYWRIIGVFDSNTHGQTGKNMVKLIRMETIGNFQWDTQGTNNWKTSTINALLNGAYYKALNGQESGYCYVRQSTLTGNCDFTKKGIQDKYRGMIANVTWKLGGYTGNTITASQFYTYERGTTVVNNNPTSTTGYVGLMYPSDYGYSGLSSVCSRTTTLGYFGQDGCASWLSGYEEEWLLFPYTQNSYNNARTYNASVYYDSVSYGYGIRPVVYLDSTVYKLSGTGSYNDPYIIGKD